MKRALSRRDLERVARHAGLDPEEARAALVARSPTALTQQVEASAAALGYTLSLRDRVAMAAGVSVATVNLAYRPSARQQVSPAALAAIEREASRLGYVPDLLASGRRAGRPRLVAVCPPQGQLVNPYFGFTLQALSATLQRAGLYPVIAPIPAGRALPDLALSRSSAGVLLWGSAEPARQSATLRAAGQSVVVLGQHPDWSSVRPDWSAAFEQLTRHALARGYPALHLGHLGAHSRTVAARLEGVARALAGVGVALRLGLDAEAAPAGLVDRLAGWGYPAAAALLDRLAGQPGALVPQRTSAPPDPVAELAADLADWGARMGPVAVLGQSDFTARRLLERLGTLPVAVGVAGHDNIEPLLGFGAQLTSVAYDHARVVEVAVSALLAQLEGQGEVEQVVLPAEVVYRRSL